MLYRLGSDLRFFSALGGSDLEFNHFPVLDEILLAFRTDFSLLPRRLPSTHSHESFKINNVRFNEIFLKIAVDHPGGLLSGGSFLDRPGSNFDSAGGEEVD